MIQNLYIGKIKYRYSEGQTKFGIKHEDRFSHIYIVGKTGTGKTTLLENCIKQDIFAESGLCYFDPHGDSAQKILEYVPDHRKADLIYLDFSKNNIFAFNPIKKCSPELGTLLVSGLIETFKKQWGDGKNWGVRMEHLMRNGLLTLIEQPQAELKDLLRLYTDKNYLKKAIENITNEAVLDFWQNEWKNYSPRLKADAIAPMSNKLGGFLANPIVARFLDKEKKQVSFRQAMDSKKIIIVNLAKGKIGSDSANLLGGLLISTIILAGYTRANISEMERVPFFCYLDEFQNVVSLSIIDALSELRKYKLGLVLANQYLEQLKKEVREAVLGNAGTLVCFRLGVHDAQYMAVEFLPKFDAVDIINLPNYKIYLKLMIDGKPSQPFSAETIQ